MRHFWAQREIRLKFVAKNFVRRSLSSLYTLRSDYIPISFFLFPHFTEFIFQFPTYLFFILLKFFFWNLHSGSFKFLFMFLKFNSSVTKVAWLQNPLLRFNSFCLETLLNRRFLFTSAALWGWAGLDFSLIFLSVAPVALIKKWPCPHRPQRPQNYWKQL